MRKAISETDRRREIQVKYNEDHGITASSIVKGISDIAEFLQAEGKTPKGRRKSDRKKIKTDAMAPSELEKTIIELEEEMLAAAEDLRFEYAARLRDEIRELRRDLQQMQEFEDAAAGAD
jgi:excinuclease ABC subunit B